MVNRAALDTAGEDFSQCWCCDASADPTRMVHLGNHPEVALCVRCAHWAAKQAWEIEDQGKAGPLVRVRSRLRAARRYVVRRGWQHHWLLRGPLRWLGKRLP